MKLMLGKDKKTLSFDHETYLFMDSTQSEMEEWMKAICSVMRVPFVGGIFGQKLEDIVQYELRFGDHLAPMIVEQCVNFIRKQGLEEVGLFQLPGQTNLVKQLQDAFDSGTKSMLESDTDVHTVASLLKLYLHEQPEPVVPFAKYEDFLYCAELLARDKEEGIEELKKQVTSIPPANFNLLQYMCRFLDEVQSHSSVNKMSAQNLATVFGPNILRPKVDDAETMIGVTALVQQLISTMICEHSKLFLQDGLQARPVGEDSKRLQSDLATSALVSNGEDAWKKNSAMTNVLYTNVHTLPAVDNTELTKMIKEIRSVSSRTDVNLPISRCQSNSIENTPSYTEVNKQATLYGALDVLHSTFAVQLHGDESAHHPSLLNETGIKTRSIYVQNASVSSVLNNSGCWNQIQKNSTWESDERIYESRLSIYDNIQFLPVTTEDMVRVNSATWPKSSCEISLRENSNSYCSSRTTCPDERLESSSVVLNRTPPLIPEIPGNIGFLLGCTGSSENRDVFVSVNGLHTSKSVLQILDISLVQKLSNQKEEYEARIKGLEQRHQELESEVQKLQSNLDQQRKGYKIAEIKMRNTEQARDDTEKRNEVLLKEMEQLFSYFW
uniref:rho GTPase-activating protein 24-like n=1 Tax=Pristiophorus japonicus TaxID=55135 RepID=UPI00398F5FF5